MHYVEIENVKEGMVSVKRLFDERGILLLGANTSLTPYYISKIKSLGYQGLYIYDEFSKYDNINEIIDENLRRKSVNALKDFNINLVTYYANEIVNTLTDEKNLCVELLELSNFHDYTYQHCVNVAILAATVGIGFGFNNEQLHNLTLAALLHDIGKEDIPTEILDKPDKLTDEEYTVIKQHSSFGYERIKNSQTISATVKVSILEHHENEDGSGYPRHIKNNGIHIFAKIIHVCDVFDALVSKRSYKKAYEPSEAIEYLMSQAGKMFDVNVVNMFLKYVAVYPVGTTVTLTNGEQAQVVSQNRNMPLRPVVALKDGTLIDLANDVKAYNVVINNSLTHYY